MNKKVPKWQQEFINEVELMPNKVLYDNLIIYAEGFDGFFGKDGNRNTWRYFHLKDEFEKRVSKFLKGE